MENFDKGKMLKTIDPWFSDQQDFSIALYIHVRARNYAIIEYKILICPSLTKPGILQNQQYLVIGANGNSRANLDDSTFDKVGL